MSDDDPYEGLEEQGGGRRKKRAPGARAPSDVFEATDVDLRLAGYTTNDTGNAARLVDRYGNELIHVPGVGFFVWDGLKWSPDPKGNDLALALASRAANDIWREYAALSEKAKGDDPGDAGDRAGYLAQWAVGSGNSGRIKAMLDVARPQIRCDLNDLDADPYLLYTPTTAVRVHPSEKPVERDRAHRVTKITRAEYKPGARAEKWESFLEEIFPDEGLREFVQRAAGYSLTGDMSEESFFMCWGKGRNGKGTFLRLVAYVLGSYAATIPVELLLEGAQKTGNEPNPQYAALTGVRFAMTTEPSPNARFNEGELKTLTGRDTIRIRGLFEAPFDLVPKFKLWIACNDRPSVRSATDAYWRRVKLIPFVANISEENTNKNLELELREEAAGILAWLLEGRAAWAEKGLAAPEAVLDANQAYRDEMDPLHRFLGDCTKLAPGCDLKGKELRTAYNWWCEVNGEEAVKTKAFGSALTNKGYKRKHSNGTVYLNLALSDEGKEMLLKGESAEAAKNKGW